ncbi:MAG: creatininase family protein [Promethearchaeota archaeon]
MGAKKHISYMESFPSDIESMLKEHPIAYVPFGALEWHGPHMVLGVDSIKAEEICRRSAEITGGVLFPCVNYGAFDTMMFPFTFHFSKRNLKKMTRKLVKQLYQWGFKIIILLTGHYPESQIKQVMKAIQWISKKHEDCFALGIPEQKLIPDWDYFGDHAAYWETSMMMAINQNFVNLENLPSGLNYPERTIRHGVWGIDPKEHATAEQGKRILNEIVKRFSEAILEVEHSRSMEAFNRIHIKYDQLKKETRKSLKKFFAVHGITNRQEGLAILKWMIFKRKKQDTKYQFNK